MPWRTYKEFGPIDQRSFELEFKQNAVDLCRRNGKSECQVAREVGIPQSTLNRWMRKAAGLPAGAKSFLSRGGSEASAASVPSATASEGKE